MGSSNLSNFEYPISILIGGGSFSSQCKVGVSYPPLLRGALKLGVAPTPRLCPKVI